MTNKINLETSVAFIAAEAQAEGQAAGPRKFSI